MTHDLLEYMRGDGRLYELQYDIDGSQGTQTVQTQSEGSNPVVFYHVKGHEWERLYADDHYVYRETDTSEAPDRYYVQTTDGVPGAVWTRRHLAVGDIVERNPLVIHRFKGDCSERARGHHPSQLSLLEVKGQHTFASGISLPNVAILGWLEGNEIEEHYYYAKSFGLVAWKGRGRGESYICEIHQGRPDLVRETIPCMPPLGGLYHAPSPAEVELAAKAKGVDVSEYQGMHLDWQALRAVDGISFAILRASLGLRQDTTYQHNYRRAGDEGILRGAYHYFYPQYDAREQAQLFAAAVQTSELPAFMDVEHPGITEDMVQAFLDEFEQQTGRKAMIYTSMSKWHSLIGHNTPWADSHDLWVAHYTDDLRPLIPDTWDRWTFWQHSESGRLSGYGGDIDLDRFNGDEAALRAYASDSPAAPEMVVTDGFDFPCGWPDGVDYYVAAGVAEQDYFDRFGDWHTGEDWNGLNHGDTDLGDPVYAVANGIVVDAGYYQPSWGNILLVEHQMPDGGKVWSQYAHLRERLVEEGDQVERGQQIGTIGKGHNNRWPAHLHFEIRMRDLEPDAWGFTRDQILAWYAHPTEFITANRPGALGVVVTVDEQDANCIRTDSDYWHDSDIGLNGHAYWTYAMRTKEDCVAEWRPNLPQAGLYEVLVYIPEHNATSEQASYRISHRRGIAVSTVDQSSYFNQWVSLGQFPFSISPSMPAVVRLSDQTGEAYTPDVASRKKIAFDAVRFVLVEGS